MPTTRRTMLAGLGVLLPACAAATTSSSSPTVTPASEAAVAPNQPASLFALIERGDIASVAAVLRERPDAIDARDERDRSGLTVALLAGHPSIAALLVAHGYRPDVVESAWLGDWDRLTTLAKAEPATVDAQHALGGTSMHAGVRGGHGRELWRVYAEGASPNPERPTSIPSPLRAAFELPTLGVVEQTAGLLLGNGADPRSPEPEGSTSLHAAAARGSVLIVEMLLRKGADPNARDARGRTPAEVAAPDATIEGMLAGTIEVARDSTRWRTAFDVDDQPYRPEPIADIPGVVQRTFVGLGHGGFDQLRAQLKAQPR
ncbi:MAG: ankyrin repeat domain-containing protein, partial [Deltaproteobacteria bacterium]|nr:ankyrin repeat domain-containing protein [Deltaproteobacteria bacterium]